VRHGGPQDVDVGDPDRLDEHPRRLEQVLQVGLAGGPGLTAVPVDVPARRRGGSRPARVGPDATARRWPAGTAPVRPSRAACS
jgi:hypothetical protein